VVEGTMTAVFRGTIITEGLRPGVVIGVDEVRVSGLRRQDQSGSVVPSQPDVWSVLEVELPGHRVEELAAALSAALRPEDGWYADFRSDTERVVVFAGRVFRYRTGDVAARDEAVAYGRAAGTPEQQLDWDR
jgi:hypothetical protein